MGQSGVCIRTAADLCIRKGCCQHGSRFGQAKKRAAHSAKKEGRDTMTLVTRKPALYSKVRAVKNWAGGPGEVDRNYESAAN